MPASLYLIKHESLVTFVIPTIGRETLGYTISSILREGFGDILVISDGHIDLSKFESKFESSENVHFVSVDKVGSYGLHCVNVSPFLTKSKYIFHIADDDEIAVGSGDIIRRKLLSTSADIIIPTLVYNDGSRTCYRGRGVAPGNVSAPTCLRSVLFKVPISEGYDSELHPRTCSYSIDYRHIYTAKEMGLSIDWYDHEIYLVRPRLPGMGGYGK